MQLKDKVAVITGGSSGLGFSIAKKLLEKGSIVYILGRHEQNLKNAFEQLKSNDLHVILADVTDYQTLEKKVGSLDIDILINNAGVWLEGATQDFTPEQISGCLDINLKGTIYATKAVLPSMLTKNNGFILNVISTSGLKGREQQSVYAASKFGVSGFTKSLELDLAKTNIKVAGFYPGGMRTKLFEKAGNGRDNSDWMDTDKVAEIVIFLLERDDTMVISSLELNKHGTKMTNK
jgi:NADP-dependent 3-hydroxy acid dehydrogenase YdfG